MSKCLCAGHVGTVFEHLCPAGYVAICKLLSTVSVSIVFEHP